MPAPLQIEIGCTLICEGILTNSRNVPPAVEYHEDSDLPTVFISKLVLYKIHFRFDGKIPLLFNRKPKSQHYTV